MSWSVNIIGRPEAIAKELEARLAKMREHEHNKVSADELEAALPHLQAIVRQNFGPTEPVLSLSASGHGYVKDGETQYRTLVVDLKSSYATLAS